MAHYAFLDENNVVVEVVVGRDEGELGIDWEAYYGERRGLTCRRTSYRTFNGQHPEGRPFRHTYAGIGFRFDPTYGPDGGFFPPDSQ